MTEVRGVEEVERAGLAFAEREGFSLIGRLGFGQDGSVYRTSDETAVKVFAEERLFFAEWEAYLRIEEAGLTTAAGHAIPGLRKADFGLWVLHLDLVYPPFVLDFARVSLGARSERRWPPHVWAERVAAWERRFPRAHWPRVLEVREALGAAAGVWLEDLHPGNVRFEDSDEAGPSGSTPAS